MYDKQKYNSEYTKNNYDKIMVLLPKGRKAEIKRLATQKGITMTQVFVRAVEECYNVDLS